jgi:hypothetical protein
MAGKGMQSMARWMNSRGASSLLVVLAILLVAGLLYWLNLQSQNVDDEVRPVTEGEASGDLVDFIPAQLAEAPESVIGEVGVLRDIGVSQGLGRGVIAVDLDGENRYPVLLSRDLIAAGAVPRSGERVTVYGRIYVLNDSIRGAWVEGDAVDEGSEGSIPRTSSFLLADSLTFN